MNDQTQQPEQPEQAPENMEQIVTRLQAQVKVIAAKMIQEEAVKAKVTPPPPPFPCQVPKELYQEMPIKNKEGRQVAVVPFIPVGTLYVIASEVGVELAPPNWLELDKIAQVAICSVTASLTYFCPYRGEWVTRSATATGQASKSDGLWWVEKAETRANARAIRVLLGIKVYTKDELDHIEEAPRQASEVERDRALNELRKRMNWYSARLHELGLEMAPRLAHERVVGWFREKGWLAPDAQIEGSPLQMLSTPDLFDALQLTLSAEEFLFPPPWHPNSEPFTLDKEIGRAMTEAGRADRVREKRNADAKAAMENPSLLQDGETGFQR